MRFLIHSEEYGEYAYRNYIILLLIFTAYSIFCVIFRFELFSFSNKIKTRNAWSAIEIVLDTIFITMFYMINGKVDSDFFLFYYLPLLTSAQYFGINVYLITFVCISMSYISAIYVISMSDTSVFFGNSLLRVFLGREIFFLLVSGAVVYLLHNARHQNRYVEKIQKALDNAFSGIEKLPKLNQSIDQFLRTLVDDYRCEYATVSLVDEQRNTITSFRGINTPLGWIERSAYDLESEDITARTARLGRRSKIMSGWSEYFNREIYDRFQHNLLARVFIPLLSDSKSIGALEVGCNVDRKEAVFTDENIANIEGLATRYGPILDENRPHKILKSIAEEAMKIIDADSASIHIFAGPIEKFVAGAGRAEPSFLKQLPRRPVGGLGAKALRSDKPRWIDDPSELRAKNPALFEAGVRAICAIPLGLQGHHMEGVLYLHFWQPHIFDFIEIDIERVYAREISWIIRTLTDFAKLDEEGKRAKAITDLHNIVFSVTADADPTEALEEIARQALYLLDADSIHLYTLSSTMNNAVATVGSVPEVSSTGTRPQKKNRLICSINFLLFPKLFLCKI